MGRTCKLHTHMAEAGIEPPTLELFSPLLPLVYYLNSLTISYHFPLAIGVTNQRETTLVWDKETGEPLYNAIVWLDLRTQSTVERLIKNTPGRNKNHLKHKTGLPISTYFSAVKLRWLMDNVEEVRKAIISHTAMFGTVDSWLIWCLTGGKKGGVHVTDVTNASRTMLFNIHTMDWDPDLCIYFGIPMEILPKVRSSSEIYGLMKSGPLTGVPISGCLGDQSAALVGQMCFQDGLAKNTYGTGCFLLRNTGTKPVMSDHGLLTTVAYKLGRDKPACYALEGSVAIAGAVVRWLKDNLGIIQSSTELGEFISRFNPSPAVQDKALFPSPQRTWPLVLAHRTAATLSLRFRVFTPPTGNRAPEGKFKL
ncbi:hypothetical protein QTP86_024387 [Hemibagrus guttatus]|nr:hypothetical protein QTP86_024387 [Hemibagrus guttatus]